MMNQPNGMHMRPSMNSPAMSHIESPQPPRGGGAAPWMAIILIGLLLTGVAFAVGAGLGYGLAHGPQSAAAAPDGMGMTPGAVQAAVPAAPPPVAVRSTPAAARATQSALQTLRAQLELYRLQHQDDYPTLAQLQNNWGVMLRPTNPRGSFVVGSPGSAAVVGPYLQNPPVNPLNGKTKVCPASAPAAAAGWAYDEASGRLTAVAPVGSAGDAMADGDVVRVGP